MSITCQALGCRQAAPGSGKRGRMTQGTSSQVLGKTEITGILSRVVAKKPKWLRRASGRRGRAPKASLPVCRIARGSCSESSCRQSYLHFPGCIQEPELDVAMAHSHEVAVLPKGEGHNLAGHLVGGHEGVLLRGRKQGAATHFGRAFGRDRAALERARNLIIWPQPPLWETSRPSCVFSLNARQPPYPQKRAICRCRLPK